MCSSLGNIPSASLGLCSLCSLDQHTRHSRPTGRSTSGLILPTPVSRWVKTGCCYGTVTDGRYQTDAFGAPSPPEELIKLFWELEGLNPLHSQKGGYAAESAITKKWLEDTFAKVGQVVAESVKAGAECGSFGLQFMPNAFEVGSNLQHRSCWCKREKWG
jgi:hypothetical protein